MAVVFLAVFLAMPEWWDLVVSWVVRQIWVLTSMLVFPWSPADYVHAAILGASVVVVSLIGIFGTDKLIMRVVDMMLFGEAKVKVASSSVMTNILRGPVLVALARVLVVVFSAIIGVVYPRYREWPGASRNCESMGENCKVLDSGMERVDLWMVVGVCLCSTVVWGLFESNLLLSPWHRGEGVVYEVLWNLLWSWQALTTAMLRVFPALQRSGWDLATAGFVVVWEFPGSMMLFSWCATILPTLMARKLSGVLGFSSSSPMGIFLVNALLVLGALWSERAGRAMAADIAAIAPLYRGGEGVESFYFLVGREKPWQIFPAPDDVIAGEIAAAQVFSLHGLNENMDGCQQAAEIHWESARTVFHNVDHCLPVGANHSAYMASHKICPSRSRSAATAYLWATGEIVRSYIRSLIRQIPTKLMVPHEFQTNAALLRQGWAFSTWGRNVPLSIMAEQWSSVSRGIIRILVLGYIGLVGLVLLGSATAILRIVGIVAELDGTVVAESTTLLTFQRLWSSFLRLLLDVKSVREDPDSRIASSIAMALEGEAVMSDLLKAASDILSARHSVDIGVLLVVPEQAYSDTRRLGDVHLTLRATPENNTSSQNFEPLSNIVLDPDGLLTLATISIRAPPSSSNNSHPSSKYSKRPNNNAALLAEISVNGQGFAYIAGASDQILNGLITQDMLQSLYSKLFTTTNNSTFPNPWERVSNISLSLTCTLAPHIPIGLHLPLKTWSSSDTNPQKDLAQSQNVNSSVVELREARCTLEAMRRRYLQESLNAAVHPRTMKKLTMALKTVEESLQKIEERFFDAVLDALHLAIRNAALELHGRAFRERSEALGRCITALTKTSEALQHHRSTTDSKHSTSQSSLTSPLLSRIQNLLTTSSTNLNSKHAVDTLLSLELQREESANKAFQLLSSTENNAVLLRFSTWDFIQLFSSLHSVVVEACTMAEGADDDNKKKALAVVSGATVAVVATATSMLSKILFIQGQTGIGAAATAMATSITAALAQTSLFPAHLARLVEEELGEDIAQTVSFLAH